MKVKSKIIALAFALSMLGSTGCKAAEKAQLKASDVELWGVPATWKVTQEVNLRDDSPYKTAATVNLTMARGEYESSQIIITPKKDVKAYDVKVNDLTLVGGTDKFPKENISVYHEKYLTVTRNKQNNGAPLGNYPDALVPLDAIKEYKENYVEANTNQGVYVTFEAEADQKAGVYTGTMQMDFGSFEKDIPIRIEVLELTVSETAHAKNIFQTDWPFDCGELNSTQAMMDAYADKLIEYRLAPHRIVKDTAHTDEDIEYYTEKAYGYMVNPRCSNIGLPDRQVYDPSYGDWITDFPLLKKYIMSFVEKSFETNFNMLEKTVCYLHGLDEPEHNNTFELVKYVCTLYKQFVIDVANEVRNMPTPANVSEEFKESVAVSIEKIRNVVTCTYREELVGYIDTWCPAIDKWDGVENQANYADQEERWWYGANNPNYPYPTYDLICTNMSLRMYGWMQADYGIVGNLYWSANNYMEYTGDAYLGLEQYYTGPAGRYNGDNTEGFLFYPGGQYGLNEPVASMRLEAIRDGYEEYELIYALQEKYEQLGFDSEKALKSITNSLYLDGRTQFTEDVQIFANARKSLFELCSMASSEAGVCIVDYEDDGRGSITHKIYVEDETELKNHGEILTGGVPQGTGTVYTVQTNLENAENSLFLTFTSGGVAYEYTHALGGKVLVKTAEEFDVSAFKEDLVAPVVSSVEANTVDPALSGKLVKLVLPYKENEMQRIFFEDALWKELGTKTSKIVLRIYNPTTETISFDLSAKYSRSSLYSSYLTGYQLVSGMNEIEINLSTVAWNKMGSLEFFVMLFGSEVSEPEKTVYVSDVSVYYK